MIQRAGFTDVGQYPTDSNNIAPRLGFAYDLTGDGRTVVRGGYGMFYEPMRIGTLSGSSHGRVLRFVHGDSSRPTTPTPVRRRGSLPTDPFLRTGRR